MKTTGLIGGMTWESAVLYYRVINQRVRLQLGGKHSAKCLMYSMDFAEFDFFQQEDRWDEAEKCMLSAAQALERGGADFVVICTNTMNRVAEQVEAQINIPLLHIADATGEVIQSMGLLTVGLVGTCQSMEEDFYRGRLARNFNLEVLIPDEEDRILSHHIIVDQLLKGEISEEARQAYKQMIRKLVARGAGAIILGCTEIGLLIDSQDVTVPLLDAIRIHAEAAVSFALAE